MTKSSSTTKDECCDKCFKWGEKYGEYVFPCNEPTCVCHQKKELPKSCTICRLHPSKRGYGNCDCDRPANLWDKKLNEIDKKVGDSLRKQEELSACCGAKSYRFFPFRLGCIKCAKDFTPKVATSERKAKVIRAAEDFADRFEPVMKELAEGATSEKEWCGRMACAYPSTPCPICSVSRLDTPHESEGGSWDDLIGLAYSMAGKEPTATEQEFIEELEKIIKQASSKSYQRGREEGLAVEHPKIISIREARQSILSLAVQEIEKMPAFTPHSDKTMGKVADSAKKPMWGTNYLQREAVLDIIHEVANLKK